MYYCSKIHMSKHWERQSRNSFLLAAESGSRDSPFDIHRVFSFEVEAKNMCSKGLCLALSVIHEARLLAALFLGRCLFLFLSRSLSSLRERVEQKKQWLMN